MKTKMALGLYYVAIGTLVVSALVIVWRLIILPPCTQIGNSCVIEPWSVASLAGTVLAVAATVLAILGAVAVAGWWGFLENRVNDQVTKLYDTQKAEVRQQLDDYVAKQKQEINDQLGAVQASVQSVESRISTATTDIDELERMTHNVEEAVIDGLMILGAQFLEEWAKKAVTQRGFSKVPAKMTEGYLHTIAYGIDEAETEAAKDLDKLNNAEHKYKD